MQRRRRAASWLELLAEFGLEDLEEAGRIITERSEDAMRRAITALPDGTYDSEVGQTDTTSPFASRSALIVHGDEPRSTTTAPLRRVPAGSTWC